MNYTELLKKHNVHQENKKSDGTYNKEKLKSWVKQKNELAKQIDNLGDDLTEQDLDRVVKLVDDLERVSLYISSVYFSRLTRDEILQIYEAGGTDDYTQINNVLDKIDQRLKQEEDHIYYEKVN